MEEPKIIGKECKLVFHLRAKYNVRPDTHVIKEAVHYDNGDIKSNLKVIKNYNRPFWITKEHYRDHKDKKEAENIDKLQMFRSTESDLLRTVGRKLGGIYSRTKDTRIIKDSPYVYGLDVNSKTFIKQAYTEKYPDITSRYDVCAYDIEVDTNLDEIIVISVVTNKKLLTVINKKFLTRVLTDETDAKKLTAKYQKKLDYLYDKHIPKTDLSINLEREIVIVDDEVKAVLVSIATLHIWKPDFVAIWNITYDLDKVVALLTRNNVDLAGVFSDPDLPEELKYFEFKKGMTQHTTASGKFKPINLEEQWHTVIAPASFYWIDAMSAHRYIRVGGKSIPGGYSLDNILHNDLGKKYMKLKFEDGIAENLKGLDWHVYMVEKRPLEYIVYNQWDVISMIELDNKTKDLNSVLPMLAGISDFDIFNSGPKQIVNAMHFFYVEHDMVLASKPSKVEDMALMPLSDWIVLLPSFRIKDKGRELIPGSGMRTNTRMFTEDADQTSGYPSDGIVGNVSKDTTVKELKSIGNIPIEIFRLQNINLLFGSVNSTEYCTEMHSFPSMYDVIEESYKVIEEKKEKINDKDTMLIA